MNSTTETSSITGCVLGSVTIVVTPPAAAASPAVSIVSLCSSPGSRSCTRMSTRPGARHRPSQSTTSLTDGAPYLKRSGPKSAISPSWTSSAPGASSPLAGSSSRALR